MDDFESEFNERWSNAAKANMRRLMKARGITYRQLAEMTGIPKSTLSGIGSADDRMTIRVLGALAIAFEVSTDELLGLGSGLANAQRRKPSQAGGVVDLKGVRGRFIIPIGVDIPELDLRRGDLIEMDTELPMATGKYVAVQEHDGVSRLYLVRSMDPSGYTVLVRGSGPPVLFAEEYHTLQAVGVFLHRHL